MSAISSALLQMAAMLAQQMNDISTDMSSAIFNVLGTMSKGEPPQILYNSDFSGAEAWKKFVKMYSPTAPMRGMRSCWRH